MKQSLTRLKSTFQNPFNFMLSTFIFYVIFALIANTPSEIWQGLLRIYTAPSLLIEDYIEVGGMGAALINAASIGVIGCLLMKKIGCDWSASNVMSLWLSCGFAFFGKNPINIMPILLGGVFYCWFRKEKLAHNLKFILLSTTLAPVVSQMRYVNFSGKLTGYLLGTFLGFLIGFVSIPVSGETAKAHRGYNLYNMGFAGGIIGIILSAVLRNFGIPLGTQSIWSSGNNLFLSVFLVVLFAYLIVFGCFVSPHTWKEYFNWRFFIVEDATNHDSYHVKGEQSYQNMGTLGLISLALMLILKAQISGPIIGGILTIVGFGSKGKTLWNMFPIMIGCMLGAWLAGLSLSEPTILLAILFSTTLSPIANRFGLFWGILAGFLHLHTVSRLGDFHGGLSLYNNGLAGGLVVTVLVPVIFSIRRSPRWKKVRHWYRRYLHFGSTSDTTH